MRRVIAAAVTVLMVSVGFAPPAAAAVPDPVDDPAQVRLSTLDPATSAAKDDRPVIYTNGCHAAIRTRTPTLCRYGDTTARRVIVTIGDSHLAQWFSALDGAARREGFRLLWASKRACPAVSAPVLLDLTDHPYRSCRTWRDALLRRIAQLPRVDLVVMTSSHWHTMLQPGTGTPITAPGELAGVWRDGTRRTLRRLHASGAPVLILRDTPNMRRDVPTCLRASGGATAPCSATVASAFRRRLWVVERELAAARPWVTAAQLTSVLCASGSCRPVTDSRVLRYRDEAHLTDTFVRLLTGRVRALIRRAAAAAPALQPRGWDADVTAG